MKHFLTSSIGKKLVMGVTGFSLIAFLLVHCYVNSLVFIKGPEAFEAAAHFLGNNLIMHIAEFGLFVGLIAHIVQGIMLTMQNRSKRPVAYNIAPGNKSSKWYSRSMGLLGSLILLFLILHLWHFWLPNRGSQVQGNGEINLIEKMRLVFENPIVVLVYVLGCISLGFHLAHGFWSAFQTLGLNTPKYRGFIRGFGLVFSVFIAVAFAAMPVAIHFGLA